MFLRIATAFAKGVYYTPVAAAFICLLLLPACRNHTDKAATGGPKRTSVTCFTDSAKIKTVFAGLSSEPGLYEEVNAFYRKRNYACAWISINGVNESAGNFINILNNGETADKKSAPMHLDRVQSLYRRVLGDSCQQCCGDTAAMKLEVMLTINFFDFARRNWGGVSDDILKEVSWLIVRKKLNYEELLADFLAGGKAVYPQEPVYRQYGLLKSWLKKYRDIELAGGWPQLPDSITLAEGDTATNVSLAKKQLSILGDLTTADSSEVFDSTLLEAVKRFQQRHGLGIDGTISGKTLQALRVPVAERIGQILINMERCRWVPAEVKGDYLVVNIPQFQLLVYESDSLKWSCNVIVGKSEVNNTVIFNDSMEFIVFCPYWNITQNILYRETLPAIRRNRNYLSKNNLEVVTQQGRPVSASSVNWDNTGHFPYIIRQKPGPNNSLGLVKFLFPNPYDIYMHDTPAKSLFNEPSRAFSHGCIRVQEPQKLAEYVLKDDPAWTSEKISAAMHSGKEKHVKLRKKIPVFIAYFTSWVDRDGKLNLREDVYGHDEKMKHILFVN